MSSTSQPSSVASVTDRWSGNYYSRPDWELDQEFVIRFSGEDVTEARWLKYKNGDFHLMVSFSTKEKLESLFPGAKVLFNSLNLKSDEGEFKSLHDLVIKILGQGSLSERVEEIVRTNTLQ